MSGNSFWTSPLTRGLLLTSHPVEGEFRLVRETLKVSKNRTDSIHPTQTRRKELNQLIYHDACTNLRFLLTIHTNRTLNFYNIGQYFMLLLHTTSKILRKPIDRGKLSTWTQNRQVNNISSKRIFEAFQKVQQSS
jgi:hypothetical protein